MAWPRSFIDKSPSRQAKVRLSRTRPLYIATERPRAQDQTSKKRRGVEAYKFFQNWLRVTLQCAVPPYIVCQPTRPLAGEPRFFAGKTGLGQKKFALTLPSDLCKIFAVARKPASAQKEFALTLPFDMCKIFAAARPAENRPETTKRVRPNPSV